MTNKTKTNRVEEWFQKFLDRDPDSAKLGPHLRKTFDPDQLNSAELESLNHYLGIAASIDGDSEEAIEHYENSLSINPYSPRTLFSLGQEYEALGRVEEMRDCHRNAYRSGADVSILVALARYAYLWNFLEDSADYLNPIVEQYFNLRVVEDHFLNEQGLPQIHRVWGHLAALHYLGDNMRAMQELTERAAKELMDYDFRPLQLMVECLAGKDVQPLVKFRKQKLESLGAKNHPTHLSLANAIPEAQEMEDYNKAAAHIDAVKIGNDDLHWLNHVKTAAKAELECRLGSPRKEMDLLRTFFQNLPGLLEPEFALEFSLLNYQERLKEIYRAERKPDTH